ncbi:MAG: sigma-70 family RNA polymerase sigma factor [Prevotella sp.]|nr:sigma-70 family RNA polymerase sigma factor [Prevotella sp.]
MKDEIQLIERGRQGDETALGSLYRAYHRQMTMICQRIVGNQQVAEELAHDAFLLAFAKMDQLRNPQRFEAWLTSITTNVARRYMQRHHDPTMLSLSTLSEEEFPMEPIPTDDKPLPTMAELMVAIDELPNGYGQVFKLAVIQEMSHKEIAEILGIAAHSSSSQLSRAKKMLKKSLAQYWLLWLMPLVLPLAIYLYKTGKTTDVLGPIVTKQEHTTPDTKHDDEGTPMIEQGTPAIPIIATQQIAIAPVKDVPVDSLTPADTLQHTGEETESTDTTTILHNNKSLPDLRPDKDINIADLFPEKSTEIKDRQKWSVDLAYTGSMGEQNANRPFIFTEKEMTDIISEVPPIRSFDKWSDYAEALQSGTLDIDNKTYQILLKIAQNNAARPDADKIERTTHHYMPVTFSLALKYKLNSRFGLETGLSYNRLKSEFEIGTDGNAIREQQAIHYLGIPLKGTYNIYDVRRWNLYGSLGAKLEIPVYAPFSTSYFVNGMKELEEKSILHAPLQWSVGTGLGLQYNLTPNIGFFAEPSLQYYIPTGSDIETYRTEHPFTFSLPIGIRITW